MCMCLGVERTKGDINFISKYVLQTQAPPGLRLGWK